METIRTRQMEDEIYKLRQALLYYADERIYFGYEVDVGVGRDRGEIARKALSPFDKEPQNKDS